MDYAKRLQEAGVRVTSVRLLVYRTVCERMHNAFTLQDVMEQLAHADNSSVFRTLTLFVSHRLLHQIDDGSAMHKYCVCRCGQFKCHHIHLSCTRCGETVCLKDIPIPEVSIPSGFLVEETEFVVKGICQKCQEEQVGAISHLA